MRWGTGIMGIIRIIRLCGFAGVPGLGAVAAYILFVWATDVHCSFSYCIVVPMIIYLFVSNFVGLIAASVTT